jgi:hypothetical protein
LADKKLSLARFGLNFLFGPTYLQIEGKRVKKLEIFFPRGKAQHSPHKYKIHPQVLFSLVVADAFSTVVQLKLRIFLVFLTNTTE